MTRLLLTALLAVGIAAAEACCVAYPDLNKPVTLVGEQAIIIWDPVKKEEHFIRQASFKGNSGDLGFIVPTPGMPNVVEADQKAFRLMHDLAIFGSRGAPASDTETEAAAASVTVIDEYEVGDYQAAILRATDGRVMAAWLKKNGYASRPAMEEWLDFYAKKEWFFAALKLNREPDSATSRTSAVRVSFKTDTPHYPYKMPTDTWPKGHMRPLKLYFITSGGVAARYAGTDTGWEATIESPRQLGAARADLAQSVGLTEEDIPAGAEITMFTNSANEHGYDRDLEFQLTPTPIPLAIPLVAGSVLLGTVIVLGRRRRSSTSPPELQRPPK